MSRIPYPMVLVVLALISALAGPATSQDQMPVFGTTVVIPGGLRGQVYHLKRDTEALPRFEKLKSKGTVYTASLNVPPQDFKIGFPGLTDRFEWFAIDYTGRFWVQSPGVYRFNLMSDDGSRLWIDDRPVINNDGVHPPRQMQGQVELAAGIHRIEVAYFQGPRFVVALVLQVAPPGEDMRLFHVDQFKPPPGTEIPPEPSPAEPGKKRK